MKTYNSERDYIKDIYDKSHKKLVKKRINIIRKELIKAVKNGYDRIYTFLPMPVANEVAQFFKQQQFLVEVEPYMSDNRECSIKIRWE